MEFADSTVIRGADYDPDALTLDVTFTSGRIYTYFNVPEWKYDGLITASSAG
jgi:lysyl-tRNA synthetase class 2